MTTKTNARSTRFELQALRKKKSPFSNVARLTAITRHVIFCAFALPGRGSLGHPEVGCSIHHSFLTWGTEMIRTLERCLLVCALASFCVTAIGAEKKSSTKSTKSTASKAKTTDQEQLTGRLPRYFSSLVDEKQRDEIYEIQASYRDKIEELEKQLADLRSKEMAAIEKVLTTTQRKKLADLRSGEKPAAKASSKTASSKSASSKSSEKTASDKSSTSTKAKPASSRSKKSKTSTKK